MTYASPSKKHRSTSAWLAGFGLAGLAGLLSPALVQAQYLDGRCAVRNPNLQGSYAGGCIAGWASGQGRAIGKDRYEGSFLDGHASGRGVYSWSDGRRFEGEFRLGKVNGRARYFYANGDMLEGEFRDNQLVGVGRLLRSGGTVQHVQLQEGVMVAVAAAPGPPAWPAPTPVAPGWSPGPSGGGTTVPAGGGDPMLASMWQPQLDLEDLFPAYIFATATMRPSASTARTTAAASPGSGAALLERSRALLAPPAGAAQDAAARVAGASATVPYHGDPWGLIGLRIRTTQANTRVGIRVLIDDMAEPTEQFFDLAQVGTHDLYPRIRYRFDRLRSVTQPTPVNVSWSVTIDGRDAGTRTLTTRVRSIQDAPLAAQTARGVLRMPWIFAGFVTEDAPWIDTLIRDSFAGRNVAAVGYQQDRQAVMNQTRAVYEHLQRLGVKYSSITTSSGESPRVASQIVRFPSDSIRTAQANCIDGSVLLASVLRKIAIEPLIITGPGHAMMGVFIDDPDKHENPAFVVIETTMLGSASFDAAIAQGKKTYLEWAGQKQAFEMDLKSARLAGIAAIPR
ncbi:MAG: hypothetical protein L6Q75_05110 [Burkholderiaceae bacterium]|nr:hypothetical protein [Burkholderiaceae bacterium]